MSISNESLLSLMENVGHLAVGDGPTPAHVQQPQRQTILRPSRAGGAAPIAGRPSPVTASLIKKNLLLVCFFFDRPSSRVVTFATDGTCTPPPSTPSTSRNATRWVSVVVFFSFSSGTRSMTSCDSFLFRDWPVQSFRRPSSSGLSTATASRAFLFFLVFIKNNVRIARQQ